MMVDQIARFKRDEMYQKNVKLLPEYVREQIKNVNLNEIWKQVDVIEGMEGFPVCRIKRNGHDLQINSKNPIAEVKGWSDQLSLNQVRTLFVYGCGFGYPLFELVNKRHKDSVFVVFEPNVAVFMAMLHYFDLAPIMETGKFVFFIGTYENFRGSFVQIISTLDLVFFTIPSIIHVPNSRLFKAEYREIQHKVFERIGIQIKLFGNDHYDALLGFHNMIKNIKQVLDNPYMSNLKNRYENVPAFIIANGPSLDKQLPELKRIKGKALILCCESSIVPLLKNNIVPDAIFVLERTPQTYTYHFKNVKHTHDSALFAFAGADPRVFQHFPGQRIPVFRAEHNSLFINKYVGDGTGFFSGTSVAHMAFEIADYMGANPIVLVGQDLAYGPEGDTHSKDSIYADPSQKNVTERIHEQPVIYLESNDGHLLRSNQTWHQFKIVFEQMIGRVNKKVINTTESGAKLLGATFASLSNVIDQYVTTSLSLPLHTLIAQEKQQLDVSQRGGKLAHLRAELKRYIVVYRALAQTVDTSKELCAQMLDDSDADLHIDVNTLHEQYSANAKQIIEFMSPNLHPTYFQPVVVYGAYQIHALGPLLTSYKLLKAIEIQFKLFDYIKNICESLVRNFEIALEELSHAD